MSRSYIFTSESVGEGHPDKMADTISDSVLDAILAQDPKARVACETLVNTGMVVLAGEITTTAQVDYNRRGAQGRARHRPTTTPDMGFDGKSCGAVLIALDKQSPDIAQGVKRGRGPGPEPGRR